MTGWTYRVRDNRFLRNFLFLLTLACTTRAPAQEPANVAPVTERTLTLTEGENWVSAFLVSGSNAVAEVLGRDRLPAGNSMFDATRVEWYGDHRSGGATHIVWLADGAGWRFMDSSNANDYPMPLDQSFNLVLPEGAGRTNLVIKEQLPASVVGGKGLVRTLTASGAYSVVSFNLPFTLPLSKSGLRESGFAGAPPGVEPNPKNSDELRVLESEGDTLAAPVARILMDDQGRFVYWTGGPFLESAEDYELDFRNTIVVHTARSTNDLKWRIDMPYPLPKPERRE